MFKTLFAILFSVGTSTSNKKQIDKKIVEANKNGAGIWRNGKKYPLG